MPRKKKKDENIWEYQTEQSFLENVELAKKHIAKIAERYTSTQKKGWGPAFWSVMHGICAKYPVPHTQEDVDAIVSLFDAVLTHIPCAACKQHFVHFIRRMNQTIEEVASRGYITLNAFIWLAHNNATRHKNMDNRIKVKHKMWTWRECVLRWNIDPWEFPEKIREFYEKKGLY